MSIEEITTALNEIKVDSTGVSFAGKSLKLDSEADVKIVIDAIEKCINLEYLNLEGNTLGVEAAKAIAKALEKHPEFKKAQWKDMFTGRMKTEIPKALEFLGNGLVTASARLTELDLSDNAFGPIGVEGLAALLRSSSCYALEELRLNNNGLGITGGRLLAAALTDCYNSSKKLGKPLALKVFIAGRNRLENNGAKALANFFKMIGSLQEVAMPQNGIYHEGIGALSESFAQNKNLQILNLNDNTITEKGAKSIAAALPNLQRLKEINLGDCLLKTQGAVVLAKALEDGHSELVDVNFEHNEINKDGGLELVNAMKQKYKLKNLGLNGNNFGGSGCDEIRNKLGDIGKANVLESLSEDEADDGDEDDEDEDEDEDKHSDSGTEVDEESSADEVEEVETTTPSTVTIDEFLKVPSVENWIALGDNKEDLIIKQAQNNNQIDIDNFMSILMNVSSLSSNPLNDVSSSSLKCSEALYKILFKWAQQSDKISIVNNTLLVNLGLIKSEDKKFKPKWNLEGCFKSLKHCLPRDYIPQSTKDTFKIFMERQVNET